MIKMLLPNGETLKHENAPYDPVKAHEYYVRTRHLKGRKKGTSYQVESQYGRQETLTPVQLTEQRAYASHRVSVITNQLSDLNAKLKEALAKQVKTATPKTKTAADKLKTAERSKTYRQEHKQQTDNKAKAASNTKAASTTTKKPPGVDINGLQDKIAVTHQKLLDAVAKQRRLAAAKKIG